MIYWNVNLKRTPAMKLERKIARILREAKAKRTPVTYEEIGKAVGMLPRHKSIATALGNLVWEDVRRGRPIRSSLVVRKTRVLDSGRIQGGIPGPGYFDYLELLGFDVPADEQGRRYFVENRQEEVYAI